MNAWAMEMLLWSWQALWIVAAIAVSLKVFRTASPASRHSVWLLGILSIVLLPAANIAVRSLPVAPPVAAPIAYLAQFPVDVVAAQPQAPLRQSEISIAQVAFGVWLLGALLSAMHVFSGWRQTRRIAHSLERVSQEQSDTPLGYSRKATTPIVVGMIRPIIVLPADIHNWTTEGERRAIVLHESAHLRRRDQWAAAIQAALGAVFFFHPAVRYALRALVFERELACDEAVLAAGVSSDEYTEVLLKVAERSISAPRGYGLAFGGSGRTLERRIKMIAAHRPRIIWRPLARLFALSRIVAVMTLAALFLPRADVTAQTLQDTPPQIQLAALPFGQGISLMLAAAAAEPVRAEPAPQPAQAPVATVTGTVVDPGGALIPGVTVGLTSGKGTTTVVTNRSGFFEFSSIETGWYSLQASLPGFMNVERPVNVLAGNNSIRGIVLPLGGVTTSVEVSAQRTVVPAVPPPTPGPQRIGGSISQPNLISAPKPVYPPNARAANAEGTVRLIGIIGTDGTVTSLQVDTSRPGIGNRELVEAAMWAVLQWRYRPGTLNGAPVEMATTILVNFTLAD